jgi:hypothetical protein
MHEARCPACSEVFTANTELSATILLVEHLRSIPETDHLRHLEIRLAELERLIGHDTTTTSDLKSALLAKCIEFDERLKAIHLLAASTLAVAVERLRDLLRTCEATASIRQSHAAQSLLKNLREALLVARRRFR